MTSIARFTGGALGCEVVGSLLLCYCWEVRQCSNCCCFDAIEIATNTLLTPIGLPCSEQFAIVG